MHLPRHFESSQKSNTTQHWQAQGWHDFITCKNKLQDATDHDEAVEPVEQGHKVALKIKKTDLKKT